MKCDLLNDSKAVKITRAVTTHYAPVNAKILDRDGNLIDFNDHLILSKQDLNTVKLLSGRH